MPGPVRAVIALDIVVINLARSVERRKTMEQLLAPLGLPYRFFEAVDGRAGTHALFSHYDERVARLRHGYKLLPGELGCYASHYLLWEQCVQSGRPMLVCEDDIETTPQLREAVDIASRKIDEYGLLRLSIHRKTARDVCERVAGGLEIVRYKAPPLGTSCYAVSPAAAQKLLAAASVWFEPVDLHIDRFWDHGVQSFGISPPPVEHPGMADEASEIRKDTIAEKKDRQFRFRRKALKALDNLKMTISNAANSIGRQSKA